MGIIMWIIFGALVGWAASLIMDTNAQQGAFANIAVGIVGAVLGGFLMNFIGQTGVGGFNLYSMLVALMGACIFIGILRAVRM